MANKAEALEACEAPSEVEREDGPPGLEPTERLFVPHRKRLSYSYVVNDDGARELRIDYGMKEISFDEERLFAFGEQLVKEASFTGQCATAWGAGYTWDELRPLLEALLGEGIIRRGDGAGDARGAGGIVPSQVPPSTCPVPRAWSLAECEAITADLANRPIEVGHLEAIVPVFRIAHPALDGDGRQVGEANVWPPRLRLEHVAEWRVCQYVGSRYHDDTPMNVTALKAMIKHWKPMMAATLAVRGEMARRFGRTSGAWTIGELHAFSSAVLALPTFQLVVGGGASPQPPLHPALSSLFRITDGIRMTTYEMLFSIEHVRPASEPVTAAEIYLYAENHGVLIGDTGVCAGPKAMIEEFLAIAVDGAPAEGLESLELPAEVQAALAELPAAVDYAMYGLQSWALAQSVWLAMSRAYEALRALLGGAAGAAFAELREGLDIDWRRLETLQITKPYDRDVHDWAYLDTYAQARRASRVQVGPATLAQAIMPVAEVDPATLDLVRERVAAQLARREVADGARLATQIASVLVGYAREEQAVLAALTRVQDAINAQLARPRAGRALVGRDLVATYAMGRSGRFPYLFDRVAGDLGVHLEPTAIALAVKASRPE